MVNATNAIQVRQRFEQLRPIYGSKAAWLRVAEERNLPGKLGVRIPRFVPVEISKARDVFLDRANQEAYGNISWRDLKLIDGYDELAKLAFSADTTVQAAKQFIENTCPNFAAAVFGTALSPQEMADFISAFRRTQEVSMLLDHAVKDPYLFEKSRHNPSHLLESALKGFALFRSSPATFSAINAFFSSFQPDRTLIFRSSGINEDTFEHAKAGSFSSVRASGFAAPYDFMETVNQFFRKNEEGSPLVQEYSYADVSGVAFSDLRGFTTIEALIGEGAVKGKQNTIIDLDGKTGEVVSINQGFFLYRPRIKWKGLVLIDTTGGDTKYGTNDEARTMFKQRTFPVATKSGEICLSPLNADWIRRTRDVAVGIRDDFQFPVDIEFTKEADDFNLVQVRPVTGNNPSYAWELPNYNDHDIIVRIPACINETAIAGYSGYLFYLDFQSVQWRHASCLDSRLDPIAKRIDGGANQYILITENPEIFQSQKVMIDPESVTRIAHGGINLREAGAVAACIPGFFEAIAPKFSWKKVDIPVGPGKASVYVSTEKVTLISNGFSGLLVRNGAEPIKE